MRDRFLHHARRFDDLRQEHLARSEQVADDVHPVHQRAFDDLDGPRELLPRFLGIGDDMRVDALDQRVLQPALHVPAAPFLRRLLVRRTLAAIAFGKVDQTFGRVLTAHEDHVLARLAQFRVDLVVNVELTGIHDRHVEPGGDRVIEEDRMHRAAHGLVAAKAEAQIGQAAAGLRLGAAALDFGHCFEEIEAIPVMLLDPRGDREDVGIEDDILGREAYPDEQVIGARTDFDLARLGIGLSRFVERHDHDRRPIIATDTSVFEEGLLALLHRDRIDDRLAADAFQTCLDHVEFGAVDHHRHACDIGLGGDQLEKSGHRLLRVEQALVHIDVDDLRAVLDLLARDLHGWFIIARHDQLLEARRSGDIGALADIDEAGGGKIAHGMLRPVRDRAPARRRHKECRRHRSGALRSGGSRASHRSRSRGDCRPSRPAAGANAPLLRR